MRILGNIKRTQKSLRHGGGEVLRAYFDYPTGNTQASSHFSEIMKLLEEHVKNVLFQEAAQELENLAANGRSFAFCRHDYRAKLEECDKGRFILVTLLITHTRGANGEREILFQKRLVTAWSKSGDLQRKISKKDG